MVNFSQKGIFRVVMVIFKGQKLYLQGKVLTYLYEILLRNLDPHLFLIYVPHLAIAARQVKFYFVNKRARYERSAKYHHN